MRRLSASEIVLKVLGVLLIAAAVLKSHELLTVPVAGKDLWSWRPFLIFQVEFELALGIWLLSGVFKRLAWFISLVCFLPNLSLPNFKEMAEPRLRISIDGSRPEDAITEGASVNVKSSLFTVQEHNLRADKEGKVHCTLLLNPVKKLEQGLYPDRLIVELGPDLKLSRRISFRIIGPVWSETATINFGSVAVGKVSSRNVTLHFQSDKTAWPQVNVIRTEPDTYSGAVTITDVAWDDKGKHTDVTLTFHPAMLSGTVKGFFHFKLFLGNKHPDPKGMAVENTDLVKLHVYGMVVGSHSQE